MDEYFHLFDGTATLCMEAPDVNHHTCHVPIGSKGEIGEVFVLRNHHNFGAVTRMQRVVHPELEELARSYAQALVAEGGCGPLSVQFRPDKNGNQMAQEMNLRTTGSTFARLIMGQDELGYLVRDLLPDKEFPIYARPEPAFDLVVTKSLATYSVMEGRAETLTQDGQWRND